MKVDNQQNLLNLCSTIIRFLLNKTHYEHLHLHGLLTELLTQEIPPLQMESVLFDRLSPN